MERGRERRVGGEDGGGEWGQRVQCCVDIWIWEEEGGDTETNPTGDTFKTLTHGLQYSQHIIIIIMMVSCVALSAFKGKRKNPISQGTPR